MIRPLITCLLVISTLICKAQTNKPDTLLRYLIAGDPKVELLRARHIVGKNYGFCIYSVASCQTTQEIDNWVDKENKRVYKIVEQRFGKNWKIKFNKEVDSMMKLQARVEELVMKQGYIIAKLPVRRCFSEPAGEPNIFLVKAYGYGTTNGITSRVTYFKLTVDLATNTVTKDSDTVEPFVDPSNF